MFEWFWLHAGEFSELLALLGVIATSAIGVIRMLIAGRKQVQGLFEGQKRSDKRMDEFGETLKTIADQFKPNGGTSLFDMIQSIRAYQWNFAETLTDKPVWESDANGSCVKVNIAYTKLAERNPSELIGSGWENFVDPADRTRVYTEWCDAVERKRIFESTFRVRSRSGTLYQVKATAMPVVTDTGRLVAFVGRYDDVMKAT
jgi:PAS domain S-box-containing protein